MMWLYLLAGSGLALALLARWTWGLLSRHESWPAFSSSRLQQGQSKHCLLVFAHPDDEAMFFVPTVRALRRDAWRISFLCLSNGSGGGIGSLRATELIRSGAVLGVKSEDVEVIDDARLQDGMRNEWDVGVVSSYVAATVARSKPSVIVTFDPTGVSGHINHRHVFMGVQHFSQTAAAAAAGGSGLQIWTLQTLPALRRFSSIFEVFLASKEVEESAQRGSPSQQRLLISSREPSLSHAAMRAHASQYVWFRKLFVAFSSYTFVNSLLPMSVHGRGAAGQGVDKKSS